LPSIAEVRAFQKVLMIGLPFAAEKGKPLPSLREVMRVVERSLNGAQGQAFVPAGGRYDGLARTTLA
jgi:hypothetical protein